MMSSRSCLDVASMPLDVTDESFKDGVKENREERRYGESSGGVNNEMMLPLGQVPGREPRPGRIQGLRRIRSLYAASASRALLLVGLVFGVPLRKIMAMSSRIRTAIKGSALPCQA